MDDDLDVGVMRTPIWTLDTLTSTFGTTLEMMKEAALLHSDAQSWLPEARNTREACVGGVRVLCFLPIHSGHQVRWTYRPGSHRRKVT